jgi:PAS domain S-box-containing protein
LAAAFWTLLFVGSYAWNARVERERVHDLVLSQASALVAKDIMYRHWSASLGGVWADAALVAPNPYLAEMGIKRDKTATDGSRLTLVNPAYMTRMVFEIQKGALDVKAKITSLKLVNPANQPDAWEENALRGAERGETETHDESLIDGRPYLRYLRALPVEKGCLKCHERQGYKLGDIRGGISVAIPLDAFYAASEHNIAILRGTHGFLWLAGMLGLLAGYRNYRRYDDSRLEYETALQEGRAHFRAVVDTAMDSIVTMNREGRIVEFNPMAEQTFGYRREEVIGRLMADVIIPEEFRQAHHAGLRRFLSGGGEHVLNRRLELSALRRDGARFPVELTITLARGANGESFFTGYLRDITERKRNEAAMVQAKEAAEAANRAKSAFLANMSHEFRTPLNAIMGMSHLVRRSGVSQKQEDQLGKIDAAGKHLLDMINSVLEFSRSEAGVPVAAAAAFSVEELAAGVAKAIAAPALAKGLRVAVDMPAMPTLIGDAERIRQALLNYAENAVKFTLSGEVILRVRLDEETADDALLRFEVEDTGIGVPADVVPHLFSMFRQADDSTTRRYGGTGLGLAITMKTARAMGGDAGVESVEGAGSTFWFTVRLGKAARAQTGADGNGR